VAERNTFDYPGSRDDVSLDRQDIADRNRNRTILWVVLALVVLAVVYFAASASWQTTDTVPTTPAAEMTAPATTPSPPAVTAPEAPAPLPMTPAEPATPPAPPATQNAPATPAPAQ
jgi:hypothetical protein